MAHARLLALPKELRLQVWSHVLTNPSMDELVLEIRRKPSDPSPPAQRYINSLRKASSPEPPNLYTRFEKPRSLRVNLDLLRTCRFVYEEALPTLYHSVTFCLRDLQGILPLFLAPLSPFARSHIRYIRLSVRESSRDSTSFFYWALTCAQVAGLAQLRCVDVVGGWPFARNEHFRRTILFPLLRIKAPKRFLSETDVDFQALLDDAARNMDGRVLMRKAATAAGGAGSVGQEKDERIARDGLRQEMTSEALVLGEPLLRGNPSPLYVRESDIASSLDTVTGIEQFEKELLHWNIESHDADLPCSSGLRGSGEYGWMQSVETLVGELQPARRSRSRGSSSIRTRTSIIIPSVKVLPQEDDSQEQATHHTSWTCSLPFRALTRRHKRLKQRANNRMNAHEMQTNRCQAECARG